MTGGAAIPAPVAAQMIARAIAAYPRECCGALLGLYRGEGAPPVVQAAAPLANVAARPRIEFAIDPRELAALSRTWRGRCDVVGFYHSHPDGPPRPSRRDIARAAPWPGYLQAIVGRAEAGRGAAGPDFELRSFLAREGEWVAIDGRSDCDA